MPKYEEKTRRSTYTAAQKRAFHSGQGYRLAEEQKAIAFKNPDNKQSFINGYKSIDPSKYGPNRKAQSGKCKNCGK